MTERQTSDAQAIADRVLEFAEEVEASGESAVDGAALEAARAALHKWVDGLTGVVVMPAFGRVTVIHQNGRESTISSPDLPFAMSAPIGKNS